MPLVSIVLPTRDRKELLAEAVASIKAQTLSDWELILVDDASAPDAATFVQELASTDPRIRFIQNARHELVATSLNEGFALAQGDYWTWTSDDNLYHPEALEVMVKMISDADFVYADMTLIDDVGQVIGRQKARPIEALLLHNVVGSCFLYRKAVGLRVGPYEKEWILVEDWDYWIRVLKAGFKMKGIPDDLYDCRMHSGSLVSQHRQELDGCIEAMLHRHVGSLKEPHKSAAHIHLAMYEHRHGHRKEARQHARHALTFPALRNFRLELIDAFGGPGASDKWTKARTVN